VNGWEVMQNWIQDFTAKIPREELESRRKKIEKAELLQMQITK